MEPNPSDFKLAPGIQPYIKLHGSSNWMESASGGRILIMGGRKAVNIDRFPLLTWYHSEFRKMLLRPGARLMVIGYSFSDVHINDTIVAGLEKELELFVVDRAAMPALMRDPRIASVRDRLIGMSQRPLSGTFGGDLPELGKLNKFFS